MHVHESTEKLLNPGINQSELVTMLYKEQCCITWVGKASVTSRKAANTFQCSNVMISPEIQIMLKDFGLIELL